MPSRERAPRTGLQLDKLGCWLVAPGRRPAWGSRGLSEKVCNRVGLWWVDLAKELRKQKVALERMLWGKRATKMREFYLFIFLSWSCDIWKFPGSNQSDSCWPAPQPQRLGIISAAARGHGGSLTCWSGPAIKSASLWTLRQVLNPLSPSRNSEGAVLLCQLKLPPPSTLPAQGWGLGVPTVELPAFWQHIHPRASSCPPWRQSPRSRTKASLSCLTISTFVTVPMVQARTDSTRDSGSAIVRFAGIPFTGQRANATPNFSGCGQATRVERLRGKPVLSGRVLSLPLSWNPSLSGLAWLRIFRCLQQI